MKTFYLGLCGVALAAASLAAQTTSTTFTKADADEIQGLSAKYAAALGTCQAEAYAGLFTPDGIFYSSFRGTIQGTGALVALVKSERHCQPGAERPTRPGGGSGAPALQFGRIVPGAGSPTTAKMTVTLPNNGGNYEDVYAKTAAGWRFANRSHYPPAEVAARAAGKLSLTSEDVLDIQQLVARYGYVLDSGAEGGKAYADLFTDDGVFASPQATVSGREALLKFASGHRPGQGPAYVRNFATNVKLEPTADGARGRVYGVVIAIGENNQPSAVFAGGHFEDTYAKTPAGWRFKRRQFVPSEGGPTTNVGKPTAQNDGFLPLTPMDRIEIQHLIARYAYALDTGGRNGYDYADLFTPDGVFVGMNQGPTGRSYRGRDTLASLARGGSRNPNYVSHFITNVVLQATPEGAKGTEYAIIGDFGANGSTDGKWTHGGRYEDTYVKTPDGWRFKTRVFYASEAGADPKQLKNDPLKAPPGPTAVPGDPAPAPVARATGLRRLTAEDYVEIQQLVVSYPYALDTAANNGFDYADLFSPDGEFIRPPTKGRDNLAKLALDQPHGANYVRHYLANQLIEPTADGAVGKQYLVVIDVGENGKPSSLFLGGHYEDVYTKTDAGWKFKRREFIPSRLAP